MTTPQDLPEKGACQDPSHASLTEQEETIHRLTHQGIDATEQGRLAEAQRIFTQALALSRSHALPQWEAQSLMGYGVTLDRAGEPAQAIVWFEQALPLFQAHGTVRMTISTSIFLANMLTKTGDPERSLPILQQALEQARSGFEAGDLPPDEYEYECYSLYRELGRAYLENEQYSLAQKMYQQALELNPLYAGAKEISALYQDIIALHWQQGSLASALTFGEQVQAQLDPSFALHLEVLADVTFQLGLLCLQTHHHRTAVRYAQLAFQYMQQWRVKKPEQMESPQVMAFLGRTCVNIGSGYGGTADSLSLYATTLAYWRSGKDLLGQVEAEDVVVPRDNIAGLKSTCDQQIGSYAFEQLWQKSEPLYQEIQAWLSSPDTAPGPLLTTLMTACSDTKRSIRRSLNARDTEQ